MEYTVSVGDMYETYIGTPDEILYLLNNKPKELELVKGETLYQGKDKLIEDIHYELFPYDIPRGLIERVVDEILKHQRITTP